MAESKVAEFKMDAEFKIAAIIMLTENERVKFFWCKWWKPILAIVSEFKRKTKMAESKLAKLNMAEFKMAAIIKLSQNEWVKVFFVQMAESKMAEFKMSCHHQVESEWMSEVFFADKMAELKMADFKIAAIIKLSQNEWVKFFCANIGN